MASHANLPSVEVLDVVRALITVGELILRKSEFSDLLEVPPEVMIPLDEEFRRRNISTYDYFKAILENWVSRIGQLATISELRMIFCEEMHLRLASDNLKTLTNGKPQYVRIGHYAESLQLSLKPITKPLNFGVGASLFNFIGRLNELQKLTTIFESQSSLGVLVSGLGGIGKTELTRKFIQNTLSKSNPRVYVAWLAGQDSATLKYSIQAFNSRLKENLNCSQNTNLKIKDLLQLHDEYRLLCVVDNVDEVYDDFKSLAKTLFSFGPKVFLIVTSRIRDLCPGQLLLLPVLELGLANSMEFVKLALELDDGPQTHEEIRELCEKVQCLPLALQQIIGYIKQQRATTIMGIPYSVRDYLKELDECEYVGLDVDQEFDSYSIATMKVWDITIRRIPELHGDQGTTAVRILEVLAFLPADALEVNSVLKTFHLFKAEEENNFNDLENAVGILIKYNLINSISGSMNIHRLVQSSLRLRMKSSNSDLQILSTFLINFKSLGENGRNSIPKNHILSIWSHVMKYKGLLEKHFQTAYQIHKNYFDCEDKTFAIQCEKHFQSLWSDEHKSVLMMRFLIMEKIEPCHDDINELQLFHAQVRKTFGNESFTLEVADRMIKYQELLFPKREVPSPDPPDMEIKISSNASITSQVKVPLRFGIKPAIKNFFGREMELKILKETCFSRPHNGISISGLRGMGKSELVKKFIQHFLTNINVIWLSAETRSNFRKSLQSLCRQINVNVVGDNGAELEISKILENIQNKFKSEYKREKMLIVLSIDEENSDLLHFVNSWNLCDIVFIIIISTRKENKYSGVWMDLELNEMEVDDCVKFVQKELNLNDLSYVDIISLCTKIKKLPLALQHSVAYLKQRNKNYSIKEYMERILSSRDTEFSIYLESCGYSSAVAHVWDLSMNRIINEMLPAFLDIPSQLLCILSLLHPDFIDVTFLAKIHCKFYHVKPDQTNEFNSTIRKFEKYGLISAVKNKVISIHPLLQLAIRTKMNKSGESLRLINFWDKFDAEEYNQDEMIHILYIWEFTTANSEHVFSLIASSSKLIMRLTELGMTSDSLELAEFNARLLRNTFDDSDLQQVLKMDRDTMTELWRKGDQGKALQMGKILLHEMIYVLGYRHSLTVSTVQQISRFLSQVNRSEALIEWLKNGLPPSINKQNDFAELLLKIGKYKEAHAEFEVALRMSVELIGPTHPDILGIKHSIAETLNKMGEKMKALDLFKEVLETSEEVLGLDHIDTIATREWVNFLSK